ncbi:MAG: LTA synthase family protein [Bacillota bacterium]
MDFLNKIDLKEKKIFYILLIGFLIKYNYFCWSIFNVPSVVSLIIKNIIIILTVFAVLPFFLKTKNRKTVIFILYFFFTVFFLANLWYNRYFGNYLSLADITMGQGIRPYKVLFRQLWRFFDIIFVFEIPIIIYYIFFKKESSSGRYIFTTDRHKRISLVKNRIILLLIVIILLGGQIFYTGSLFSADGFLELYEYSSTAFVNVYGIFPLYAAEFMQMKKRSEEADGKIDTPPVETEKKLSGDYDIKDVENVLVIQLESMDDKIIDYEYNGREVTPFLNRIKDSSMYFPNIYAQHINGSFDAEFSFLTSLYPINKNYAFKVNDMAEFNTIVKKFNDQKYNTLAFHGNEEGFFYRDKGYLEMGFDRFYSRKDFSVSQGLIGEDSYLGINDYDFFYQSLEYISEAEQPFFAFLITVSSHTPFDFYPEEEKVDEFDDISSKFVRDYFNSMHFVDKSLNMFFQGLEKMDLLQETLVVIYSDHTADINKEEYSSGGNFIVQGNVKEPENIPLIFFHPDIKNKVVGKSGTHTDIAPTLFDILGYEEKPSGFLGVSLLKKAKEPLLFLHEIPQILFKNNLFIRMPSAPDEEAAVKNIAVKEGAEEKITRLPHEEILRLDRIINYMREIMNKILSD